MEKNQSTNLKESRIASIRDLGHGVGLRSEHFQEIFDQKPKVDWFEAISENFMDTAGRPLAVLEKIRADYSVGLHGTSLSLGSVAGLNQVYLEKLKKLIDRIQPEIISDHLCWSEHAGARLFDLLPLPFTEESVRLVVRHLDQLQNYLKRQFLIENVSAYVTFKHSTMTEWEFLNEIARQSGCGILLDVNNIYVNSFNHKFDPVDYLEGIDPDKVMQYHISGHTDHGKFLFDTHTGDVIQPVWDLYAEAVSRFGDVSSLIEWDSEIRKISELLVLNEKSREIANQSQSKTRSPQGKAGHDRKSSFRPPGSGTGPGLREVQQLFAGEILKNETTTLGKILNDQSGDSGIERMPVYAEGYPARIREALLEAYPAVLKVLGDGIFSELAVAFSKSRTFGHYNLNRVAEYFPDFIKATKWNKAYPFLSDLAELELAVHLAFHALSRPAVSPHDFAAQAAANGENLIFQFQEHVYCIRSPWPVLDIWNARNLSPKEIKIKVDDRPQSILVYRAGEKVVCQMMDQLEAVLFQGLMRGEPLGKALEFLSKAEDLPPVQEWFSGWMSNQLMIGFQIKPTPRKGGKTGNRTRKMVHEMKAK